MLRRRKAVFGILSLASVLALEGCKIVPIMPDSAEATGGFDAAAYVEGLWGPQALPHFSNASHPVADVLPAIAIDLAEAGTRMGFRAGEGSPWSFVVSGTGVVLAKNTESRAGTLDLAVEGVANPVVLQIGPVVRGNAVRDALPFVTFQDFTNQLEFAAVGKALTAKAVSGFSGAVGDIVVGDTIAFNGAISIASASDRLQITPVMIEKAAP